MSLGRFNVGSVRGHAIVNIFDSIRKLSGRDANVLHQPMRGYDVPRLVLDISAVQQTTGWVPMIRLEVEAAETLKWVQGQLQ